MFAGQRIRRDSSLLLGHAQSLLVFSQALPCAVLRNQVAFDLERRWFCLRGGIVVVLESFVLLQFLLNLGLGIAAGADEVFFGVANRVL